MLKPKVIFSHIVAVSQNDVIGIKNKLPWHIPEDLKYFYNSTKHKALIMGRKTFESLGKPLPHRLHVVISRQQEFLKKTKALVKEGLLAKKLKEKSSPVVFYPSIDKAMEFCSQQSITKKYGKEIFITGGGEIYKQSLPLAHRLYITRIYKDYKGDAFYPKIPAHQFRQISCLKRSQPLNFDFLVYEKL